MRDKFDHMIKELNLKIDFTIPEYQLIFNLVKEVHDQVIRGIKYTSLGIPEGDQQDLIKKKLDQYFQEKEERTE